MSWYFTRGFSGVLSTSLPGTARPSELILWTDAAREFRSWLGGPSKIPSTATDDLWKDRQRHHRRHSV